jgi:hypothetical protein
MNKRLGTLVAAVALVAMAEVGSGAPSALWQRPPQKCGPSSVTRRPCQLPPLPPASASKPRR